MLVRALPSIIAHGIAGAARIRHALRPLIARGRENNLQPSGAMRRENAQLYLPSLRAKRLVRRSSTSEGGSNPCRRTKKEWIASSASLLAMTADCRVGKA